MSYTVMWTVFLLFFLNLTNFTQSEHFWGFYLDYPRSNTSKNYCKVMMEMRGLMMDRYCLPFHTFIHAPKETILNICAGPESQQCTYTATCHKSAKPIRVTDCYIGKQDKYPHCNYKQRISNKTIQLHCEKGQPKRLQGPIYPPRSYQ